MNLKPVFEKTNAYQGDHKSYNQRIWDVAANPEQAQMMMRYHIQKEKLDDRHIAEAISWNKKNGPAA